MILKHVQIYLYSEFSEHNTGFRMEYWHECYFTEKSTTEVQHEKPCWPISLPFTQCLDSGTFQIKRSQLKLPPGLFTRLGTTPSLFCPSWFWIILWCPAVVRFGNNNTGVQWGHIFPPTEKAAVTSVPFDTNCFQLQEFSSQLTLFPGATQC